MRTIRISSVCLVLVSLLLGTLSDAPRTHPPLMVGGYRVLVADFHVHSFPLSWTTLAPWDTVIEAQHQGLDVIAMTPHNHVWIAKVGHWFSKLIGGPTVLVGEEIAAPRYHLLAVGVHDAIPWNLSSGDAINAVHRQGGVVIAAHPRKKFWPPYDDAALGKLDGSEVQHPLIYATRAGYPEILAFYERTHAAAIGDSDYHGLGPMGVCRTYVFAQENSAAAVLEAIRARHTVVLDRDGRTYGDPELIQLVQENPEFAQLNASYDWSNPGWMARVSALFGILGIIGLSVFGWEKPSA